MYFASVIAVAFHLPRSGVGAKQRRTSTPKFLEAHIKASISLTCSPNLHCCLFSNLRHGSVLATTQKLQLALYAVPVSLNVFTPRLAPIMHKR